MAINHIGPVVLISHLSPILKQTAERGHIVRISNQANNAQQAASDDIKFESLDELNRDIAPNRTYGRSKLSNILYAPYFTR